MNEEQKRPVRENMTEEELVIFDILTRPAPELSADERAEVKKVARELLNRLKLLLVLNWRQKSTARSQIKLAIQVLLDTGPARAHTAEFSRQKCAAIFEHVYESYPERDAGVYVAEGRMVRPHLTGFVVANPGSVGRSWKPEVHRQP